MESAHCRTALLVCGYREGLEAACCILFLLLLQAASRLRGSSCPLCVLSAALAEPVVSPLPPYASMLRAAGARRVLPLRPGLLLHAWARCTDTLCAALMALLAVACMSWLHACCRCFVLAFGLSCIVPPRPVCFGGAPRSGVPTPVPRLLLLGCSAESPRQILINLGLLSPCCPCPSRNGDSEQL